MRYLSARLAVVLLSLLVLPVAAGAAEPSMVADLNSQVKPFDPDDADHAVFRDYTAVNGRVVFFAYFRQGAPILNQFQCGLWVTDGSAGGTRQLFDICGVSESYGGTKARILGSNGTVAFFTDFSARLWRTDGTAAGTFSLGDVTLDPFAFNNPFLFGPGRRLFFFRGCSRSTGCELWRSDGTREGTRRQARGAS